MHGFCSLVVPVRDPRGVPAALKVSFDGDDESLHEGLALQHWAGNGTVGLLRADPRHRALLLERLHPQDLTESWDLEACEIVAGFYERLHRPALPQLRPLTAYVDRWLDDLEALGREIPVPRRMVEQAIHLGRGLTTDDASTGVMIHGDLHYENVLAGDREPWLVIDPKPMSGDAHWEPAPMLWNRWEELAGDLRDGIRRRFHTLVDAGGLDEHRARDWVIVRMVIDASWTVHDARRADRAMTNPERDRITQCVALVKAVQD
ncbi:aminoglycoside phosphotransferase family protein [Nocardioides coralli]|nr:aminoglycoside phosphotransferase family protein [Nocardioides coralli]